MTIPWLDTLIGRTLRSLLVPVTKRSALNFGAGFVVADDPVNDCTTITATGGSGGQGTIVVATQSALKSLAPGSLVDGQLATVKATNKNWTWSAATGAGIAGDDYTTAQPTSVITANTGRWYAADGAAIVPTIAALRAATAGVHQVVQVLSHTTAGDGGGGVFVLISGTATDNGGTKIQPSGTSFHYERHFSGALDVSWFGGRSNAAYQNGTTGEWYQDAGLTTQATDDGYKLRAAIAVAAATPGGTGVHWSGNLYLHKTSRVGPKKEFVPLANNITIFGDGDTSVIRVPPGINTAGEGGYGAVFGLVDEAITVVNGCTLRNFKIDFNGRHNLWPGGPPTYGGVANPHNCGAIITAGSNNRFEGITTENHNGIFGLVQGTYGNPGAITNSQIVNCRGIHTADDPLLGDSSHIVSSGTNCTVAGCSVTKGTSISFPSSPAPASAYEIHGFGVTFTGNSQSGMLRLVNIAGDSTDFDGGLVSGNYSDGSTVGITFFQLGGHQIRNLTVSDNVIVLVPSGGAGGENGIDTAIYSILGNTDGNGFVNVKVTGNSIKVIGTPTAGGDSNGIRIVGNIQGLDVVGNRIENFATQGIDLGSVRPASQTVTRSANTLVMGSNPFYDDYAVRLYSTGTLPAPLVADTTYYTRARTGTTVELSATRGGSAITLTSAGTGTHTLVANRVENLLVQGNKVINPGTFGVVVAGTGDAYPTFLRCVTADNQIDADNGSLTVGIEVDCYSDSTCHFETGNRAPQATTGQVVRYRTDHQPALAYYLENAILRTATIKLANVVTGGSAGYPANVLENPTPATAGVPLQHSPELLFMGRVWDGGASASKYTTWTAQGLPSLTAPTMKFGVLLEGGSFQTALRITRTLSSGTSYFDAGGGNPILSFNGGNQMCLYYGTPISQPTRVGQLTDSTGGSADSTLVDVTTAGLADPAKVNNNFADLVAKMNAIETRLSAAGGGIGVTQ